MSVALVEHHPSCPLRDNPGHCTAGPDVAELLDERNLLVGVRLGSPLLYELERRLRMAGVDFMLTHEPRWNASGDQIGPDVKLRSCEADVLMELADVVGCAIDEAARRLGAMID